MLAINQKNRRLPGFRFEAFAPAREDVLPRMDVALFVGFAATGPIGTPVAVESAEQFAAIFGADLPLVWDGAKGEMLRAHLAPTVRAFFRNGGARCWILRVARLEASAENPLNRAVYNFFPLEAFARADFAGNKIERLAPAFARARSKGSWSDDLRVGTAVLSSAVRLLELSGTDDAPRIALEIGANESLSNGDLLKFTFEGAAGEKPVLLAAIDEIENAAGGTGGENLPAFGKRVVAVTSKRFLWLTNLSEKTLPGKEYKVRVKMWARRRTPTSETSADAFLSEHAAVFTLEAQLNESSPAPVKLKFSNLRASDAPPAGSLLFAELNRDLIGLQVREISFADAENTEEIELDCHAVNCRRNVEPVGAVLRSERLTFELRIEKDRRSVIRLRDLAFNAGHRRFWGGLPTDEEWYRFFNESGENPPAWTQNAETENFPLAGSADAVDGFYFPLFAGAAQSENYLGAVSLPGTKLQRDGLERFDAELFLDPQLKNTGAANLLNDAEFIRYLAPRPRSLRGIHHALVPETISKIATESAPANPAFTNCSLEECTLVAVPDAAHRGWSKNTKGENVLSPPVFPPLVFPPPVRPEWWRFQDCRNREPKAVRRPPGGKFLDCGIRFVEAPEDLQLRAGDFTAGKYTLDWRSAEIDAETTFVLEEATSPAFEFPQEIFRGAAANFEITGRAAGTYFYRVRAEIGRAFSDWSEGLAVRVPPPVDYAVSEKFEPDVLLAVQRALLRMCAARGDLFAILNLPEHFDEREAFAHVATLKATRGFASATAGVEPFSADETKVLSFGAVYHPWLLTRGEDFKDFRNVPPDGAILGTFAKRAVTRGAWIAPANETLHDVLGLAREFRRGLFTNFQDNSINLVRQEPRGFLVLASDTLADAAELRPLNVRRLLNLLRRLAIKHGAEYVFEPNNESFRRQVQRGFDELLDLMFTRGAFAGTTPANSYQVVVSVSPNDFQSREAGRFIVELRVAPSLPLKFVTVRLVQAGGRSLVAEAF
ncbi:MAG TPA: hypothetical protein VIL74_13475 [Pyrinomonadaceae bacterium]|jgi:hypothetical protein